MLTSTSNARLYEAADRLAPTKSHLIKAMATLGTLPANLAAEIQCADPRDQPSSAVPCTPGRERKGGEISHAQHALLGMTSLLQLDLPSVPARKRPRPERCCTGQPSSAGAGNGGRSTPQQKNGKRPGSGSGSRPSDSRPQRSRSADGSDGGDDLGQGGGRERSGGANNNSADRDSPDQDGEQEAGNDDDDEGAEEAVRTETQCFWCDDGGSVLQCDGPCMRVFHYGGHLERDKDGRPGTFHWQPDFDSEHAADRCNPLEFEKDLALAVITSSDPFFCCNCLANRQYCYDCKGLATDDEPVVRCVAASCGKFYHPQCLRGKARAAAAAGGALLCPQHSCVTCGSEGDSPEKGELVPCRRCPRAYHEECIPPTMFSPECQRVWMCRRDEQGEKLEGTQVDRSLLYCLKHKMRDNVCGQLRTYDDEMWEDWQLHYARQYPHLQSSKEVLKAAAQAANDGENMSAAAAKPAPAAAKPVGVQRSKAAAKAAAAGTAKAKVPAKRPLPPAAEEEAAAEVGPAERSAGARVAAPAAARRRVQALFDAARKEVFKEDVRAQTRQPVPYDMAMRKTVDMRVLADQESALRYAAQRYAESRDPGVLRSVVDRGSTLSILKQHDDLVTVLAPYLHGDRFTSFGRHFTSAKVLAVVAARLAQFMRSGDTVVDFSCGANEFVPLVKRAAAKEGAVVKGRAYDIIVARDMEDFQLKSWFEATPKSEGLGDGQRLVIGLNPPFGKNNALANKFVMHAAEFKPRLLVLIVPPATKVPDGYNTVYEDRVICRGEEFYVPGAEKRSWNKTPPAFRILARTEHCRRPGDAAGARCEWERLEIEGGGRRSSR